MNPSTPKKDIGDQIIIAREGSQISHVIQVTGDNNQISTGNDVSLPPPFTAPKPPAQFVQRPDEFETLVSLLLAKDTQRTVAITTALQGGGGFGKTTLAQAICDDERVKAAFPDGILWVTIGQTPRLVELVNNQIRLFERNAATYADINAATDRLRVLMDKKQVLIVLDDVWQESHARPFMQKDSPTCAHLITTRQQEIASWLQAQTVTVNEMKTSQAVDLLVKWLAETKAVEGLATDQKLMEELARLAEYLGEWPLLLELVAAQLRDFVQRRRKPLLQAIQDVRKRLKQRGFTAFDRKREKERNRAISISLGVSLDELDVLSEEALGDKNVWRQCYLELAVFPEDIGIPRVTIFRLWEGSASLDDLDSEDAFYGMQSLSLFTRYDPEKQTVRLHDVIRAYLAQQQAEKLPDLHNQFLSVYELDNWADLPPDEPYLWHQLTYHLHEGQQDNELRELLLDFAWMDGKLQATNINALLADYDKLPDDRYVQRMQRILRQASHVLAQDQTQLAGQLWARLLEDERTQLTSINPAGIWLRPFYPFLLSDPALIRTLSHSNKYVRDVAVTADGDLALSASDDGTVKVWDLATGQERLCFAGHTGEGGVVSAITVTPDGCWALSASSTVKVWDLTTGEEYFCFEGHTDYVNSLVVTADGRWALSASKDKTVRVWDLKTGQERLCFTGHTRYVIRVAVTANGRNVLSESDYGTIKVWRLATGQEILTFNISQMVVTADRRWVLSASGNTVKVWALETGQEYFSFSGHSWRVTGVAVTKDNRYALSESYDEVKVWALATGQELLSFEREFGSIVAMTVDRYWALSGGFSPLSDYDGTLAGAARIRPDGKLKVWNARGQELLFFSGYADYMSMTADRRRILFASNDSLKVWDLATNRELFSFAGYLDQIAGSAS